MTRGLGEKPHPEQTALAERRGRLDSPPRRWLSSCSLEFGRKQGSSKEEQERKRLIHKHKREFKGAVREIRKDNQFLARMQLSEIMER